MPDVRQADFLTEIQMKLFYFNPEHDLALANNHPNFVAPASARKMAADLRLLPLWWAEAGDSVLTDEMTAVAGGFWPERLQEQLERVRLLTVREAVAEPGIRSIVPWGWNRMTASRMKQWGFAPELIPDDSHLTEWRRLSGRETAVVVLQELHKAFAGDRSQTGRVLCGESRYCRTEHEIETELSRYPNTILKAPWSGSGKGLRLGKGCYGPPLSGWCKRVLHDQGGVVVEPYYDKVADFAFEYLSDGAGTLAYAGLSVFRTTQQRAYAGNWLAPEVEKWHGLAQYVSLAELQAVEEQLRRTLSHVVAHKYAGPLGVDLMVCRDSDRQFRIHPCVEVNLRMTMGFAAVRIGKWLSEGSTGRFVLDYSADARMLAEDHRKRMQELPVVADAAGKIRSGYLPLTAVTEGVCYRAALLVEEK